MNPISQRESYLHSDNPFDLYRLLYREFYKDQMDYSNADMILFVRLDSFAGYFIVLELDTQFY